MTFVQNMLAYFQRSSLIKRVQAKKLWVAGSKLAIILILISWDEFYKCMLQNLMVS